MAKQKAMSVYIDDETALALTACVRKFARRTKATASRRRRPRSAGWPVLCCVKSWE
ncbi:TPA: hypothetical protein QCI18_002144 [Enterobacter ludwigii]|nr:hypothetical protein [Enterobacter ludwigii]